MAELLLARLLSECLARFDAVFLAPVDHGDEADDAAIAAVPVPREECEGAALAGDRIEITADILDAEDAVLEQDLVHGLPFREILLPVAAAGPFLVFLLQMRQQR